MTPFGPRFETLFEQHFRQGAHQGGQEALKKKPARKEFGAGAKGDKAWAAATRHAAAGFVLATRQASTAVGYGAFRRFFAVELPLAGPVILSGLRVAAVSTISLATVGILVGVTNLGYLFTNGYQREIIAEIFAGVVAVMIIALVVDGLLVLAGRALMPWARTGSGERAVRVGVQEAAA